MVRLVPALGAAILVAAFVSMQPAVRAQQPPRIRPGLLAKSQSQGGVRVIVGVRAGDGFVPEGHLSRAAAGAQRAGIAGAQDRVLAQLGGLPVFGVRRFETLPYFAAYVDQSALQQLAASPDVASIAEDKAIPVALAESVPLIDVPAVWSAGYTGSGWTVAVLDTGVQKTHPFLNGRIVSEACYSNASGAGGGTSFCPGLAANSTAAGSGVSCSYATPYNDCAHGTNVAGIAAGRDYAGSPFGINGVAKNANIIAIQVFTGLTCGTSPCALSYYSDEVAALNRVYELRNTYNISSVNMSIGGDSFQSQAACEVADGGAEKAAIDQLRSVGIATVIAAGNSGFTDEVSFPGCISSAISVGSVDDGSGGTLADQVSSFSNVASFVNLLAPGRYINSSVPGGWANYAGTSMAAPHVAGAWALMRQRKPTASVAEILGMFASTGASVIDGRPFPAGHVGGYTKPRIDVGAAVAAMPVDFMSIDAPPTGSTYTQPFAIGGWAVNLSAPPGTANGVDVVSLTATPAGGGSPIFLGSVTSFGARADVAAVFGAAQFTSSGWTMIVRGLPAGTYSFTASSHNTFNSSYQLSVIASGVTVLDDPLMSIDVPAPDSVVTEPFAIGGWAIDRAAMSGPGVDAVHVYAYPATGGAPIFVGVAGYGAARPDVGAPFGSQFTSSAYALNVSNLAPGPYLFVVYTRSAVSHAWIARTVSLTISGPMLSIDAPANASSHAQPFNLGGWAIDRGALSGTGVDAIHVWAYPDLGGTPSFVGAAAYGAARSDVGGIFGTHFTSCGYNISIAGLTPGRTYRLAVFAHSSISGTFAIVRTVDVDVR